MQHRQGSSRRNGACHSGSPSVSDRPVPACHLQYQAQAWLSAMGPTDGQLAEPVKEPEFKIKRLQGIECLSSPL